MNKIKSFVLLVGIVFLFASILLFPSSCAKGVNQGLLFCSDILIPSLFPFMFLSGFIVESGIASKLGRYFNYITKILFNLPGCTAATILISFIGGYPTGAKGIKSLLERGEITLNQAKQMLCFSVGAGPAFIISVVGSGLLGSSQTGLILFFAQICASIIIGVVVGQYKRFFLNEDTIRVSFNSAKKINASNALVNSCIDATYGMINMCAFVVLFSALLTIINDSGIHQKFIQGLIMCGVSENIASSIIPILLEVTGGCLNAARLSVSAELISFALGWAGACVHFQICASLSEITFSRSKFTLCRFMQGVLSATLTHISFLIFPQVKATSLNRLLPKYSLFFSNAVASFALVVLSVFFLYSIPIEKNGDNLEECLSK